MANDQANEAHVGLGRTLVWVRTRCDGDDGRGLGGTVHCLASLMCEFTWTPFNDDGTVKAELIDDIVTPPKVDNGIGRYSAAACTCLCIDCSNQAHWMCHPDVNYMGRGA